MNKKRVAFICVHNACRSQIAEALGKLFAADVFESYSAGTCIASRINPDAVRLMRVRYEIDMTKTQHPKTLEALPPVDAVITMGCGVDCPALPCMMREDWAIADPTGESDAVFLQTIHTIYEKVMDLRQRLPAQDAET